MKIFKNILMFKCCFIMAFSCNSGQSKESTEVKKNVEDSMDTNIADKKNDPKLEATKIIVEQVKKDIDWANIKIKFNNDCLNPFLKERKIDTNCTNCDKISFSYTLISNEKGEVTNVHRKSEIIQCKDFSNYDIEVLHNLIEAYLKKLILPSSFGKGTYTGQLGFILKC